MHHCKITVLKTTLNEDLAEEYCQKEVTPCSMFDKGQEFVTKFEKPEKFCEGAWHDIFPYVLTLLAGGNFSEAIFDGWMKDDNTMITCCSDGVRPVIFKLERIDENGY